MLAEYKKKTYIGIGIAFAVWVLGGILIGYLGKSITEDDARPILTLGIIPFVYGIWAYAKAKGYHGGWGLLGGIFPFFLIILFFFPDKHKTVRKQNQEVKEPIQKENQKVMVKYTCSQCKTELEVELMAVERMVQCKECKTMINLLPPPLPKKKLSLKQKQKQKWCLWIGIAVIVLMGLFPPVDCTGYQILHYYTPEEQAQYRPYRRYYVDVQFPPYRFILEGNTVIFRTLIAQRAVVSIITGSLIIIFKDKKPKDD